MCNQSRGLSLSFLFGLFVCATGWSQPAQAPSLVPKQKTLRLFVNGEPVDKQSNPSFIPLRIQDGTVYVPLRSVFKSFSEGGTPNAVRFRTGNDAFDLRQGEREVVVNNQPVELSNPVIIISLDEGRHKPSCSLVPEDFFEKVFGKEGKATRQGDKVYVMVPTESSLGQSPLPRPSPPPPVARTFPPHYGYYQEDYTHRRSGNAGGIISAVFVTLLLAVVIIGLAIAFQASQRNSLNNVYRSFAQRVGGTLQEGSLWSFPSVAFAHGGATVLLNVYSTGGKHSTHYTQLMFTLYHSPTFRCEIYPEGFFQEIGKFFGMQDIEVGYRMFDDHFVVKSDDIESVRNFLNAAVQQEMLKLKRLRSNDHVYLSMTGAQLIIRKLNVLNRADDLNTFYESGGRICDELMALIGENGAGAIQILDVSFETTEEAPKCQICGDQITSDKVICRRCRTPHHRDCWEYNGGCSVYACRERRYVVSK